MPRTLLLHLNVEVPDTDGRSGGEIAEALQGAIEVGADDDTVRDIVVVLAEVIHTTQVGDEE